MLGFVRVQFPKSCCEPKYLSSVWLKRLKQRPAHSQLHETQPRRPDFPDGIPGIRVAVAWLGAVRLARSTAAAPAAPATAPTAAARATWPKRHEARHAAAGISRQSARVGESARPLCNSLQAGGHRWRLFRGTSAKTLGFQMPLSSPARLNTTASRKVEPPPEATHLAATALCTLDTRGNFAGGNDRSAGETQGCIRATARRATRAG